MSVDFHGMQQAIFALLDGASPALAAGGIHDAVPDDVCFPHIVIGDWQGLPDDVTTEDGGHDDGIESYCDLHVWSRYRGKAEAQQIMGRIHALAHGSVLAVSGQTSVHVWVDAHRGPMDDPDGLTRHGIVTLKIISRS